MNLTNHFLVAMPALDDPNFSQTVTYICAHGEEGAMGIVINRPLNFSLGEVLSQMHMEAVDPGINDLPVFQGGPVQRDRGFILYRPASEWDSTIQIGGDIGVATSRDILEAISKGRGPQDTLVALGYAGWAPGQIEREMLDNAWLSLPADEGILFQTAPQDRWRSAVALMGVDIGHLSHEAGHA
jgi:putative transcriptional regulator